MFIKKQLMNWINTTMITEQDYLEALRTVKAYENQLKNKRLEKYAGLTQQNVIVRPYTNGNFRKQQLYLIGLSRDGTNLINEDGEFTIEENGIGDRIWCTIRGGTKTYESYHLALKACFKKLKTDKKIS